MGSANPVSAGSNLWGDSMRLWPKPSRLAACCLIATSLSLANRATAQTTSSGALTGVVTDQTNAVVRDAEIEIKDSARGITQSAKTNGEGEYQFPFLRPGTYTLTATHPGFQEARRSITVQVGSSVTVNIALQVANARSEIVVSDEAPIIQAETADVSNTMNQKQVSEVPNPGNDLTYIVQTAPGVVMNTDLSSNSHFSILGMPAYSYLLTTDGMSNNGAGNETISGALGLLLGQNQIQEATVVSTGYSGQFGGAAGGSINYLTKSGTNGFHGNAQYYWNGSAFNANYWFNNAWNVPRPFSIANQWAGSVGGSIKKDKLFFFLDSEGLRLQVSSTTLVTIPSHQFEDATMKNIDSDSRFGPGSATHAFYRKIFDLYDSAPLGPGVSAVYNGVPGDSLGCAGFVDPNIPPNDPHGVGKDVPCSVSFIKNRGRPSQDTLTSGRVDWNASRSDRVFLRLERDSGVTAGVDPISSMFDQDSPGSWWKGEVVETRSFGPSVATQFLMGVSFYSGGFGMKNLAKSLATFSTSLFFTGLPFSNLGNSGALGTSNRTYDFSGDVVKTWGKQKLGFGANFEHTHWNLSIDGWEGAGFLSPQSLLAFYQGGFDPVSPETDFTRLDQQFPFGTLQRTASNHFGLYGQDEWHVRKSLSLTFALRAEHQSNPVCENRCFARFAGPFELISHDPNQPYNQAIVTNQRQAFIGMDRILWSPRFGFAWQPFGVAHNTVLRGGVGIFYDPLSLGLTSWFFSNPPLVNSFSAVKGNLTPGESESLFKDVAASNTAFVNGFSVGETLADFQREVPNFSRPGLVVPQQRMHAPQYQRWSLELQQALGSATSFSVGYFGHHGIHELVLNSTVNAWGFGSLPAGRCNDAIPDCAPDPRFGEVTDLATTAVSNYNGLVASFRHRMSRWSQGLLQLNYTYGHAFDELSNGGLPSFTVYGGGGPQNPNNLRDAYGPADYDVRHSFNANYVWELPLKAALRGHGARSLVNGWQVSGTFFAHTGFPYTVVDPQKSLELASKNYLGWIYAVPVDPLGSQPPCGAGAALTPAGAPQPCLPAELLFPPGSPPTVNPSALFVQAGCETDFNRGRLPGPSGPCSGSEVSFAQGRNHFRGPGYFSTDFTIMKSTKIPHWENSELRIGFQFFNILNHPNFGLPFPDSADPLLGVIGYMGQSSTTLLGSAQSSTSFLGTNQNGAARMIQLKAELKF